MTAAMSKRGQQIRKLSLLIYPPMEVSARIYTQITFALRGVQQYYILQFQLNFFSFHSMDISRGVKQL